MTTDELEAIYLTAYDIAYDNSLTTNGRTPRRAGIEAIRDHILNHQGKNA